MHHDTASSSTPSPKSHSLHPQPQVSKWFLAAAVGERAHLDLSMNEEREKDHVRPLLVCRADGEA